jgi:thiamine-phosphate pyrophosphorylase
LPIESNIPRLHILTDTTVQTRWSHAALARMAWEAGETAVQYRKKDFDYVRDHAEVSEIAHVAKTMNRCLIINDHLQVAIEVGASGVHLGKEDGSLENAMAALGPKRIVGATVHNLAELQALEGLAVSYIGIGPVFGTQSKATGLPDLGLEGLAALCAASPWPVIAIGGIGLAHVSACMDAGAYGVAVLGAFCLSDNPRRVAREMADILEGY